DPLELCEYPEGCPVGGLFRLPIRQKPRPGLRYPDACGREPGGFRRLDRGEDRRGGGDGLKVVRIMIIPQIFYNILLLASIPAAVAACIAGVFLLRKGRRAGAIVCRL